MEPISVVIPVGSDPVYLEYLPECIESVLNQTYKPTEIILVDDSGGLDVINSFSYLLENSIFIREHAQKPFYNVFKDTKVCLYKYSTVWNVGVPDAFNFGVALAENNLVFMLGSDDKMMPACLEKCVQSYEKHQKEGWYFVKYQLQSGGVLHIQNNTAMVHKNLFLNTLGGFPPSAGVGACDALLLSIMMKHMPERIIPVESDEPLCWLREGDYQDTRKNAAYFSQGDIIVKIRDLETRRWVPRGKN